MFPSLPHRTRYYRVLKRLERVWADFALRFAAADTLYVIDSKPLPVCQDARWQRPRSSPEAAASGRCRTGFFHGFKLHAVTNRQGVVCRFAIVPANEHDVTVARGLLGAADAHVIGDKGYAGCRVCAQPKADARQPRVWTPALAWFRTSIEPVFSSLLRSRHLLTAQLNSFWRTGPEGAALSKTSVRASVCRKVAAHNLAWFLTH